jgi:serine/threonine-protein kinase PknK
VRAVAERAGQQFDLGRRFEPVSSAKPPPGQDARTLLRYDAYDAVFDLPVTLLLLSPDAEVAECDAFEIEAAALSAVGAHPNVVTLYDRVRLASEHEALVLSRHRRPSLRVGQLLTPRAGVALAIKLADALETAHRVGQLHSAVEPRCVGSSIGGEPLLSGFAVPRGNTEPRVLHELSVHTAGELLLGEAPTPATDVYGLASTLYELLSGRAAFRGYEGESDAALGLRILHDPVPPMPEVELPLELADVLDWALASSPALRPPSAAWFAEELGRIEAACGWDRTASHADVASPPPSGTGGRHRRS